MRFCSWMWNWHGDLGFHLPEGHKFQSGGRHLPVRHGVAIGDACRHRMWKLQRHGRRQKQLAGQEVALHRRVCGSVSGYSVSIAPPNLNMEGHADDYEPFSMGCDCDRPEAKPPVAIQIKPDGRLVIVYVPGERGVSKNGALSRRGSQSSTTPILAGPRTRSELFACGSLHLLDGVADFGG